MGETWTVRNTSEAEVWGGVPGMRAGQRVEISRVGERVSRHGEPCSELTLE